MIYSLDDPIRVKMFGQVSQNRGSWHGGRRLSENILLYCTDGEINMKIEDERFHVEAGDILLIPGFAYYQPLDGGSCRYYFFHFTAAALPDGIRIPPCVRLSAHAGLTDGYAYTCISDYLSVVSLPLYVNNPPYSIRALFERAASLRPDICFSDQLLLDHLLRELLIEAGKPDLGRHNKRLTDIMAYIGRHYAEPLSLSLLSRRFSLSPSYIARLFQKELSVKPSEYINRLRIFMAKSMLEETNMTVTEIAQKTGFSDVYYFSRVFKKITGSSPTAARNRKTGEQATNCGLLRKEEKN